MNMLLRILPVVILASGSAVAGLVQPLKGSSQILIPAAASAPGANGTYFRSDTTIINIAGHDQTVELRWLPAAGTGEPITKIIMIPGTGEGYRIRSSDIVQDHFGVSGLGAVLLTGRDAAGGIDPTARLYVANRIWTPQPGSGGTTSQSFPAVPTSAIHTEGPVFIPNMGGSGQSGSYRTNLGIVNLDPSHTQTFWVVWNIPGIGDKPIVVTVSVPPMSMIQGAIAPLDLAGVQNVTPQETRSNLWIAYGSTIDNTTGDAWSELALDAAP